MIKKKFSQMSLAVVFSALVLCTGGCEGVRYDPARATREYPQELHQTNSVNIQVFRQDTSIEIINATTQSFNNFDLWINQRYVHRLDSLQAGQTIHVSLWDFYDVRGESFNAGGFWRADEPTSVRLVEIQRSDAEHLVGLVTIPPEPLR